jgi:hypothetical protein
LVVYSKLTVKVCMIWMFRYVFITRCLKFSVI